MGCSGTPSLDYPPVAPTPASRYQPNLGSFAPVSVLGAENTGQALPTRGFRPERKPGSSPAGHKPGQGTGPGPWEQWGRHLGNENSGTQAERAPMPAAPQLPPPEQDRSRPHPLVLCPGLGSGWFVCVCVGGGVIVCKVESSASAWAPVSRCGEQGSHGTGRAQLPQTPGALVCRSLGTTEPWFHP